MQGLKRILVGVDFNEQTNELPHPTIEAVRKAFWLAQSTGAEVTLLTVLDEAAGTTEALLEEGEQSELQAYISAQLAPYIAEANAAGVNSVTKFAYGRSWQELIREVLRENVDLLIVGTRERSTASQMLYGSTGVKLLRKCPCPIWITRPDVNPTDVATIVAAIDLSQVGDKVLHAAVSTAQLIDSRLVVVHALSYPLEGAMRRTDCSQEDLDSYRANVRANAEKEILDRLSMTDYRTLQQGVQIVIEGGPADTIVEQAVTEHQADLLVMGTIARGGIPGFLIGNTAERLLPVLKCSILAIKPDDYETPVKLS